MPIPFVCPHCELETLVDDEFAGKSGPCAGCNRRITVPYLPVDQQLADDEVIVGIPSSRSRSAFLFAALVLGALFAGAGMLAFLFLLLFPAATAARAVAQGRACESHLWQIAQAMRAYEVENGTLPPAYLSDEDGQPLLSWRVLLLPYLGEAELFAKFNLQEPWDGPTNRPLLKRMPHVFYCPADPDARAMSESNYVVIIGPRTLFPGSTSRRTTQIGDDPAQTILVAECLSRGLPWTQPGGDVTASEMQFAIDGTAGQEMGGNHPGGAYAAMADGSVRFLSDYTPADIVEALTTMNGNESIPAEWTDAEYRP